MCGIAGFPRVFSIDPQRIVKQLSHRGPDGSGVFQDQHQVLVHTRLAIIDPQARSQQPMSDPSGRYVLIFNGEIYNYQTLKEQVDWQFQTQSDTELLLALLIRYGYEACNLLEGMFAFAFYDTLEQNLMLGRDRLGKKPLYYAVVDGQLVFASELRTLLLMAPQLAKTHAQSISNWLRWQTLPGEETILPEVHQLRPGSCLLAREGRIISYAVYWSLEHYLQASYLGKRVFDSTAQLHLALRERLTQAVEKRMISDVPFAFFLSGGIDSSLLVALAAQTGQPVHTLSLAFDEIGYNEAPYSRLVAGKYQTHHTETRIGAADMLQALSASGAAMDHPSVDGLNTFLITGIARDNGYRMTLSGVGGDEWFLGYPYFEQQSHWERRSNLPWSWLPPAFLPMRWRKAREISMGQQTYRRGAYSLQRILWDAYTLESAFNLPAPNLHPRPEYPIAQYGHSQDSVAEWKYYAQPILLRDADQFGMANGVEIRCPFMDHHLIEFALQLPDAQKPYGKKLLIDAFSDLLPAEVYQRPKQGFVLPYEHWMRNELKDYCTAQIESFCKRLDARTPLNQWHRFLRGSHALSYSRWWAVVTLEGWLQQNKIDVDGNPM
ncbi:MAG TPA: asparagine synthase (glutamine-hydrolyzing) [Luteibaculaceae bacterium]|nr:asparagine synthase (glutamine-hydrolyzing) [Luteibaculaceae bacterium]